MVTVQHGWLGLLVLASLLTGWLTPGLKSGMSEGLTRQATVEKSLVEGQGQLVPAEWMPLLAEVVSLRLSPALPVPREQAPLPLHTTHPAHRPSIAVILDLLADSRLAPGEITPSGRGPSLQITVQNGATLSVRPAEECAEFTRETGHGFTCRPSPDQVIVQTREGRSVRLHNPRAAAWLRDGWKTHIPVGEAPDLDRETALAIAREQSHLTDWRTTFTEEYPVERRGGTEIRRAWVLETELPAGHTIRLVLDARTGEVLRLVQLEALR